MVDMITSGLMVVMLVLLSRLTVAMASPAQAVKLIMPVGTPPPPLVPPEVVTIEIDFDGTLIWNGRVLPDRQEREARLRAAAEMPDHPEVHLRHNKLVK